MSWSFPDLPAYNLITLMISFNGDVEKFYPNFDKVFVEAEDPFRGVTHLLGFEIANHILHCINGATYSDDGVHFDCDTKFSPNKKSLVGCLSGYAFGAFYHQIRFSKTAHLHQTYHQQCLSFLAALPEHKHVNVLNRVGLWKVSERCYCCF